MWYEIVSVQLKLHENEKFEPMFPREFAVTIQFENGDTKTVELDLDVAFVRQFNNLLRQKIDQQLNGD